MTQNKNKSSLLHLLINYIFARSAPQILSLWDECTFRFRNFIGPNFCYSSANTWSVIISLLTAPAKDSLSKLLLIIEARPLWYPSYFGFLAMLNTLSRNNLTEAVLLGKSFKSPWKQALSSFFWLTYLEAPVSLNIYILSLFFLNGPEVLFVNPGCLKCISGMNLTSVNKKLFIDSYLCSIKINYFTFLKYIHSHSTGIGSTREPLGGLHNRSEKIFRNARSF